MKNSPSWRRATVEDLDAIMPIQDQVHMMLPESRDVFADKLQFSPETCLVLLQDSKVVGYGIAHPWLLGAVPALDAALGKLPSAPDCLFIHDVAILPQARSRGAGRAFVEQISPAARRRGLAALALVSIYDTYPLWARYGFEIRTVPEMAEKLAPYGATARYMVAPLA